MRPINHSGHRFLVAGGTGDVGEGIVRSFLRAGAIVAVPSRSAEKLARLRQTIMDDPQLDVSAQEHLITIEGRLDTEEEAADLRDRVLEHVGQIDGVIASLSGPSMRDTQKTGPLLTVSIETWREIIEHNLTIHFVAAKTFLPVLTGRTGASYTFISGGGGEAVKPDDAAVSVALAGQLMLARACAKELGEDLRVNTLVLCTPIVARSRTEIQPTWLTANEVGAYTAYLASDDASSVRGQLIRFTHRSELNELGIAPLPRNTPRP